MASETHLSTGMKPSASHDAPPTPPETIALAAAHAVEHYGERLAVRHRHDGDWRECTFAEVGATVEGLARGLIALAIQPGDRVCLLAGTRVEWTYASLAISSVGGVVVPIYPTNSPEECLWVLRDSGACAVFCEDAEQLAKLARLGGSVPELRSTVVLDPTAATGTAISLEQLLELGHSVALTELESRRQAVAPGDACTIIYTSGTTGPPKGVVLTHHNCALIGPLVEELGFVTGGDVIYLYLPLAHVFALTAQLAAFATGTAIVYFGGDPQQIIAELAETRPTYFPSVPRVFEKLYAMATSLLEGASEADRERFEQAIELGVSVREQQRRGEPVTAEQRQVFEAAEIRLYSKIRALFGGRIRDTVIGAAPAAPEILRFFFACGVPVREGWGMTETTGIATVCTGEALKLGTVGRAAPGVYLQIAEDGEILVRGASIFREYWRNPEATRAAFTDDGWLRTGDLGTIDAEGYLSITGRKKDIIITAGGKNIAPANIENDLKRSRWISQAVMFGDRRPYPVALVTLDPEEILAWARDRGLPQELAALGHEPDVRALVQVEINRANARCARAEQIKRFAILPHDFTQDSGELTPTLKVKRNVVYERYAETLEGLYRG
jgi:long-chain acyl-CoA synthetase